MIKLKPKQFRIVYQALSGLFLVLSLSLLDAAAISDIRNTKHNLSSIDPAFSRNVKSTNNNQVCVFCHTPHAATEEAAAPLWNRTLSNETYSMYSSLSMEDSTVFDAAPGGASKLCLSCHDGTIAIGSVNIADGQVNPGITMEGTETDGTMPVGRGAASGYTRRLGTNLSNDHPISFTFNSTVSQDDGELRDPAQTENIGNRIPGNHPEIPLENGKVQCTTCHDPHIRDENMSINRKFLRLNRFQQSAPTGGNFDPDNDIICLGCHDKGGMAWSQSAHADPTVADETYNAAAASKNEFPPNLPVWKAACLNCHDTHTVEGSRRLLREGTDAIVADVNAPKQGGNSAIEETCYQCHQANGSLNSNTEVPDIKTDFTTPGNKTMPITGTEVHDISDADFSETAANVGHSNPANRHVECTDCHNPHRVWRSQKFNVYEASAEATHYHNDNDNTTVHTNLASGALRGSIGVEPIYSSTKFTSDPVENDINISFSVKKGIPGTDTAVGNTYVTREYQICLRCHSNYGFGTNPPTSGPSIGINGVNQYTNQAMEFQAPLSHQGENGTTDTGWGPDPTFETNNHRSWHPVMGPTGRTTASNHWLAPWAQGRGTQTMYCSDCHGSETVNGTAVPTGDNPWGPHGSSQEFILKGDWTPNSVDTSSLCFRCHDAGYKTGNVSGSAFQHNLHVDKIDAGNPLQCNWCHVAVPHGWKNRGFLVNLLDVGPEVGLPPGTEVNTPYTNGPYYQDAYLKIQSFPSGSWQASNCGGRDWMRSTCEF